MTSLPPLLATDSEREDTVEMLRAAFAEGCFDSDEHSERANRAYAAATRDELREVTRDLPRDPAPSGRHRPGGSPFMGHDLGWEFSLMLAVAGGWIIITMLRSVTAIPVILLWLVALRALGWIPRLKARRDARPDQQSS